MRSYAELIKYCFLKSAEENDGKRKYQLRFTMHVSFAWKISRSFSNQESVHCLKYIFQLFLLRALKKFTLCVTGCAANDKRTR